MHAEDKLINVIAAFLNDDAPIEIGSDEYRGAAAMCAAEIPIGSVIKHIRSLRALRKLNTKVGDRLGIQVSDDTVPALIGVLANEQIDRVIAVIERFCYLQQLAVSSARQDSKAKPY